MTAKRKRKSRKKGRKIAIGAGALLFAIVFFITWWRSTRCEVCGIDVSHYQGEINWERAAADGIRFAFIKATEGVSITDETFADHWEAAGEAGIYRGAYHFFRAGTDAEAQAKHFLKVTAGLSAELPAVLDLEVTDRQGAAQIVKGAQAWMKTVEKGSGRKPLLYTMPRFADDFLGDKLAEYPLWVVDLRVGPPRLPKAWEDWTFWQYSHHGHVDGIQEEVDLNCFKGDAEALAAYARQR